MKDNAGKSLRDMIRENNLSQENLTSDQKDQFRRFRDTVSQYQGKNPAQLMGELEHLKNGKGGAPKLNVADLDRFASTLKPMLNNEQQSRLEDIVRQLRKN